MDDWISETEAASQQNPFLENREGSIKVGGFQIQLHGSAAFQLDAEKVTAKRLENYTVIGNLLNAHSLCDYESMDELISAILLKFQLECNVIWHSVCRVQVTYQVTKKKNPGAYTGTRVLKTTWFILFLSICFN